MGGHPLELQRVRILGQLSLFADESFAASTSLFAACDRDALVEGDWSAKQIFRRVLHRHRLVLGELSNRVWMPEDTEWNVLFNDGRVVIETCKPLSALIGQAVKAPNRNRVLIAFGLEYFRDELRDALRHYGVKS